MSTLPNSCQQPRQQQEEHQTPVPVPSDDDDSRASAGYDLTKFSQLHWLALRGDDAGIRELLASCPETNINALATANEQCDQTPLHWAAVEGQTSTVTLLLANSANPSLRDIHGYSPATFAAMNAHLDTLHVLLSHTPSLATMVDAAEHTPLHWAAHHGHERIIAYLLQVAKCPANQIDADGKTPLHRVSRGSAKGHVAAARLLLRAGACPHARDQSGRTPVQIASDRRMRALLQDAISAPRSSRMLQRLKPYSYVICLHMLSFATYRQYVEYVFIHAHTGVVSNILFHVGLVSLLCATHTACWSSPGYGPKGDAADFLKYIEEATKMGITERAFSSDTYCYSCFALRVPRSKHSRMSERCVLRFDHFCPFVANDIGAANHRSLICLLLSAALTIALFCSAAFAALRNEFSSHRSLSLILALRWPLILLVLVLVVALAFVIGLTGTQFMLISRNDTTVARLARTMNDPSYIDDVNYDEGVVQNCLSFFFMTTTGSRKLGILSRECPVLDKEGSKEQLV